MIVIHFSIAFTGAFTFAGAFCFLGPIVLYTSTAVDAPPALWQPQSRVPTAMNQVRELHPHTHTHSPRRRTPHNA